MDLFDRRILACLQDDGRMTGQQLAERVGLSAAACWRRVKELEKSGVIKKYTAVVDPAKVGLGLCAFVNVSMARHRTDDVEDFKRMVANCAEIMDCYGITGDSDFLLRVVAADMTALNAVLENRLFRLPGLSQTRTNLTLHNLKSETALPLDENG